MNTNPSFAKQPETGFWADYPAQQDSVAQVLNRIRCDNWCRGAGSDLMSSLEIVLGEAMNNVIEHACADLDDRRFRLSCSFDGRDISVTIEDDGRPMPEYALPEGRAPSIAVARDDLPEGGFGWFLIRTICREVKYVRDGPINRLEMKLQKS